jgi:PPP family 3-phenylpropionic acid transporter
VGIVASPAWGVIADRFARSRLVLPAAALAAACAGSLLALTADPWLVVPVVAGLALAMAGIYPILDARALEAAGEDRNWYGRLRVWGSAAFVASAVVVGWTIERTGIHGLFFVLVPALAALTLIGLGLRSPIVVPPLPRLTGIAAVLRSPVLLPFLLAALVAWSSSAAVNGFLSIYLLRIGGTEVLVGTAWALGAVVELPLMIAYPWLAARFGTERLLVAGAGLLALRSLFLLAIAEPLPATATMLIHGGGFALLLVGGVTYVGRHAPAGAAATAQGMLSAVAFGLAMIVGPGLGGWLADRFGLTAMFAIAALGSLVAVAVLAWALAHASRLRLHPQTGAGTSS